MLSGGVAIKTTPAERARLLAEMSTLRGMFSDPSSVSDRQMATKRLLLTSHQFALPHPNPASPAKEVLGISFNKPTLLMGLCITSQSVRIYQTRRVTLILSTKRKEEKHADYSRDVLKFAKEPPEAGRNHGRAGVSAQGKLLMLSLP